MPQTERESLQKEHESLQKEHESLQKEQRGLKTHFLRRSTYNLKSEHLKRRKRKDAPIGKLKKDDLTNSNLVILIL